MPEQVQDSKEDIIKEIFQVLKFSDEKLPVFKENRYKKIMFYGEKNDFPEKLIELYNRSPKHNAIVTHKAKFICGKDTVIEGGDKSILENFNKYDSLVEIKYKSQLDKRIFGARAFEVIYDNCI